MSFFEVVSSNIAGSIAGSIDLLTVSVFAGNCRISTAETDGLGEAELIGVKTEESPGCGQAGVGHVEDVE
jgi:hypothetical protein